MLALELIAERKLAEAGGAAKRKRWARMTTRGGLVRVPFLLLLLSLTLGGCDALDTMKEGFAHSQAVSAELEKSTGLKSYVGFNWNNGSLTSVNVTFEGIPKGKSLSEISEAAKAAVLREFKQEPKQIVVAFTITK